jgi:hypothetical protein
MGGGSFYLIVHLRGDKIAGTIARKVSTCSVCVVLFIFPFFSILSINLVLEWDHTTKAAITEVAAVFLLIRDNVHPRLVSNNNIKVSQGIVLSGEKRFINSRLQQVNALAFIDRCRNYIASRSGRKKRKVMFDVVNSHVHAACLSFK